MGTPFISFLGPSNLDDYDPKYSFSQQPETIPKAFIDAMEVREEVFNKEQGIPIENEFDLDDARACHWVIYASVNTTTQPEQKDANGNIVVRKQSVTKSQPIGTIRLVPFPHPTHPEPGSSFTADTIGTNPDRDISKPPPFIIDRATTYHDGKEPYVKLGRLAVLKEFRGAGIARLLVSAALSWMLQNFTFFNPSVKSVGMDSMNASNIGEIPVWKGLICVHAQEGVAKTWEKWGFKVDEEFGTFMEEGIPHVGMFQRLNLEPSSE